MVKTQLFGTFEAFLLTSWLKLVIVEELTMTLAVDMLNNELITTCHDTGTPVLYSRLQEGVRGI